MTSIAHQRYNIIFIFNFYIQAQNINDNLLKFSFKQQTYYNHYHWPRETDNMIVLKHVYKYESIFMLYRLRTLVTFRHTYANSK